MAGQCASPPSREEVYAKLVIEDEEHWAGSANQSAQLHCRVWQAPIRSAAIAVGFAAALLMLALAARGRVPLSVAAPESVTDAMIIKEGALSGSVESMLPCDYHEAFAADLNCYDTSAADVVTFETPDMGWNIEGQCQEACIHDLTCHGYVWEKVGETAFHCWGLKNPTSPVAGFPRLRPLSGVQLGACNLPHPEKNVFDGNDCGPAPLPYVWGQKTKFLTCRPAPWARCSLFGDPHVSTFDRPYSSATCPTTPGQRHSGKFTVKDANTYRLVEMPQGSGNELLVLAKTGFTTKHTTVASAKGVAVQGSLLGQGLLLPSDRTVAIELVAGGDLVLTWDGQEVLRALGEARDEDATDGEPISNEDKTVTCWLKWETNKLSSMPGAQSIGPSAQSVGKTAQSVGKTNSKTTTKRPLLACKFFDASDGEEFMRVFVERMNKEYVDVIVTMKKKYGTTQEGICGNFNGDSADDDKKDKLSQANWVHVSGWPGSRGSTGGGGLAMQGLQTRRLDDVPEQELKDAWDRCENANVAKGLRAGCAEDIVLVADKTTFRGDAIIDEYQTFSEVWKATR